MLDPDTRRRHLYVAGQTSTGKSTLLLNLIVQDLAAGQGLAVLDPHGDLAETVLLHMPRSPYVGEFVWTQENNYFGWRSLLGEEPGSAGVSPYAAAARAADVSGLPPTYISVGGLDLFLEENLTYADRLSRAGVPVELHMYPRAYHGFYRATNARVTRQAEHDTREALRRFLHG